MSQLDLQKLADEARDHVVVEREDGIAWLRINRPEKRNAISVGMAIRLRDVLAELEVDDSCGVVVITGTGDSFHSGMDLKGYFRATDGLSHEARRQISEINNDWQWRRIISYMKPTIAMVNGYCFGGGLNPACACDLAVAADTAIFGVSEINWGIIPAGNVLKLLESVMSPRDALYYAMTGKTFTGAEAAQMRLVTLSVPPEDLRTTTANLAKSLLEKNTHALRAIKHSYHRIRNMSWDDAEDFLASKQDQARFRDPTKGRDQGMKQFLDDKTYRPGLGSYKR